MWLLVKDFSLGRWLFQFWFIPDWMRCFWIGRRSVLLVDNKYIYGVSVNGYLLMASSMGSVPSECLEEGSEFSQGDESEFSEYS